MVIQQTHSTKCLMKSTDHSNGSKEAPQMDICGLLGLFLVFLFHVVGSILNELKCHGIFFSLQEK